MEMKKEIQQTQRSHTNTAEPSPTLDHSSSFILMYQDLFSVLETGETREQIEM